MPQTCHKIVDLVRAFLRQRMRLAEFAYGFDRSGGGNLAVVAATHAVRNAEDTCIWENAKCIFVIRSLLSDIRTCGMSKIRESIQLLFQEPTASLFVVFGHFTIKPL
jgi:hypothetical protein